MALLATLFWQLVHLGTLLPVWLQPLAFLGLLPFALFVDFWRVFFRNGGKHIVVGMVLILLWNAWVAPPADNIFFTGSYDQHQIAIPFVHSTTHRIITTMVGRNFLDLTQHSFAIVATLLRSVGNICLWLAQICDWYATLA